MPPVRWNSKFGFITRKTLPSPSYTPLYASRSSHDDPESVLNDSIKKFLPPTHNLDKEFESTLHTGDIVQGTSPLFLLKYPCTGGNLLKTKHDRFSKCTAFGLLSWKILVLMLNAFIMCFVFHLLILPFGVIEVGCIQSYHTTCSQ